MVENKKILITGGAGFIASHLVEKLYKQNEITILDNFKRNAIQYTDISSSNDVKIIQGSVLDKDLLLEVSKDIDIVIHCAAIAGIYSVGKNATETMKVNLIGTHHVLEAAIESNVKKVVDFSTSEVYGPFVYKGKESSPTTFGPIEEKRWIYAISKLAAEFLAHSYQGNNGLNVITVRPFNVYGPRQIGEGAIQQMVSKALKNEDITIYNDGTQIRSWCHVDDFSKGVLSCLNENDEINGEVFNIGNPYATVTVIDLAKKIINLTSSKSNMIMMEHPGTEVSIRVPDIEKAKKLLDFSPQISLEEGLIDTISWYRNNL